MALDPNADILRIVELSEGGRPVEVLNLEDGATFMKERDTFVVTAPPRKSKAVNLASRYGGQRVVGETHDNAVVGATWRIKGASADVAIANVEALLAQVEETGRGRYLEWRPANASTSTLFEIRGPGSWQPRYQWVQFSQTQSVAVEISWPVAPLGLLLPMDVFDDFAVDSIGDYTFDTGGGTLAVSGGQLVPSSTAAKRLFHSARGYRHEDAQVTLKFTTGSAAFGSASIGPWRKRLDASNYLWVDVSAPAAQLRISMTQTGGTSTLNTAAFTPSSSTSYWLRVRQEGNVVTAEVFTAEPVPGSTPAATVSYTLTGADITKFGVGVSGDDGIRMDSVPTDWRVDDLSIEPFTYKDVVWPNLKQLGGAIPGDALALCDLYLDTSSSIYFGLIGWLPRPSTPLGGTVAPFGILEAETATNLSGWSVTSDGTARGGSMLKDATPSSSDTYVATWPIDLSVLEAEDFADGVLVLEVFGRVRLDSALVSPKLTLSLRPSAASSQVVAYSSEYGSAGKILTVPTADAWKRTRFGSLVVRPADFAQASYLLRLDGSLGAGTAGTEWGIDYLTVVSARSRIASPTGKVADSTYPQLVPTTPLRRIIRSDGRGEAATSRTSRFPAAGLNGGIELPAGLVDVVGSFSDLVPDDPVASAASDALSRTATVHFAIQPRVLLAGA